MTPEGEVKREIRAILRSYEPKVFWFMPVTTGMGQRGIPDFIVCVNGWFLGIEAKADDKSLVSLMQDIVKGKIKEAKGYWIRIDKTNLHLISGIINALLAQEKHV